MASITIPVESITQSIYVVRGQRVMLDSDLAKLYDVPTKVFNQAVNRNVDLFPNDFMFRLTDGEWETLRSQFVTSKSSNQGQAFQETRGGRRYHPNVFTEQGVAMLSSVLKSDRAKRVNIEIMRAFVQMRQMLQTVGELHKRLDELESRYDNNFGMVFEAIRELMLPPNESNRRIGFQVQEAGE